jgi:Pin2-interacting protein X1
MKLSHDPNNTKWTSDTASFGHKIMKSQGWKPGQYLGAKDANQAEHYTAANASHIRVAIKDDNLGIGAKIGSGVGHGECTGLDAFKNLLGRLNGKDEDELEKEQKSREDLRRAIYTEKRWGSVRFVPGGFLIGDKIQHLIDGEAERIRKLALGTSDDSSDSSDPSSSSSESEEEPESVKLSKKRKIEIMEEHESDAAVPVKVSKKKRKVEIEKAEPEVVAIKVKTSKKKRKSDAKLEDGEEMAAAMEDTKILKKLKKERKLMAEAETEDTQDDAEIKKRKREKDKKERKEKKEKAKSDEEDPSRESKKKKSKRDKHKIKEEDGSTESSRVATKESTPSMTPLTIDSGRSTPMMQGRHAVRSRNIAQKRLASMDVASLNQVSHSLLKSPPFLKIRIR